MRDVCASFLLHFHTFSICLTGNPVADSTRQIYHRRNLCFVSQEFQQFTVYSGIKGTKENKFLEEYILSSKTIAA
ncbi:uncharacterized protein LOC122577368 isoform X2 [Bombus pyrosoma]|uniref:uncharacterized protein LOC122577368 isoform X2 n=1 Tax=Bombus pyrosoma TaxID=396416 RepID=UPI001CB8D9D9|nr:uncharacterized protein LOC122577368 isoform X2 [Bombus pyrosoma]